VSLLEQNIQLLLVAAVLVVIQGTLFKEVLQYLAQSLPLVAVEEDHKTLLLLVVAAGLGAVDVVLLEAQATPQIRHRLKVIMVDQTQEPLPITELVVEEVLAPLVVLGVVHLLVTEEMAQHRLFLAHL
jgi:hypothetical protein